ncbi:neutral alpha-glucosidase AB isoform X2 [Hydra vulgaris]
MKDPILSSCVKKCSKIHHSGVFSNEIDSHEINNVDFCIDAEKYYVNVNFSPLVIRFFSLNNIPILVINERGLLQFQSGKPYDNLPFYLRDEGYVLIEKEDFIETINDNDAKNKKFQDKMSNGNCSVGLDVTFMMSEHVYGIPEHADSFHLKDTRHRDPYRLYNSDVFAYSLDNPMALYGSIPYMISAGTVQCAGIFWNNSSETWIDVEFNAEQKMAKNQNSLSPNVKTHWVSESGVIDMFVLLGPSIDEVANQYASLTGFTMLPPLFALGYHQCRWNYDDEVDVANVDLGFDKHNIPYDCLWLDIEHTDEKKYMTWCPNSFPNPIDMISKLSEKGRKMVTIIDPHISRDITYSLHNECSINKFYIKNKNGDDYIGECWPGVSSWIDFFNPKAREWWAEKFMLDSYKGSTLDLMTWNDMNEPAVFDGPENSIHRDAIHFNDIEHREVHNLYGMMFHKSSYDGLLKRSDGKLRPFVLSRSFFAGSQRYGPIWTGDNQSTWLDLKASIPMLLSLNIAGMCFVGADVGGFVGDPDPELLIRWYQAAAFQPFFRGHANRGTKRREPWLFDKKTVHLIRAAILKRYAILPYIYTQMWMCHKNGTALMRPLWMDFPDSSLFRVEDQYLFGHDLLVKPVTKCGQAVSKIILPSQTNWYDIDTFKEISNSKLFVYVSTPLNKIPVFLRGGSVVPIKERIRSCSAKMENDPLTLVVCIGSVNSKILSQGLIYVDDGRSTEHEQDQYALFTCSMKISKASKYYIKWKKIEGSETFKSHVSIERIIVLGAPAPTRCIFSENGIEHDLNFSFNADSQFFVIKKVANAVTMDFKIYID